MRFPLLVLFCLAFKIVFAQNDSSKVSLNKIPSDSSATTTSMNEQKDVMDYASKVFKKMKFNNHDEDAMQEGKTLMWFLPAIGYTLQTQTAVAVEVNILWRNKGAKVSSLISDPTYTQLHQLIFPFRLDLWTKRNGFNLVGDWRIMKYPQETFGLGSKAPITNNDLIDYSFLKFHQYFLKNLGHSVFFGAGVNFDYHWNITEKGAAANEITDFKRYPNGTGNSSISSGVSLNFLYNTRDNLINPEKGEFLNVIYRTNYKFLGSDQNWQSLLFDLRKYVAFPANSANILGFWTHNWFTLSGNPPYLDSPSISWDTYGNTGRGYIQGRYRGKNMVYFETEYRFNLTHNRVLGGVVFSNVSSFSETLTTNKFEQFNLGYGMGVRVKLNKFSRLNLAIDYGWGVEGSKGLFVNVGEVF